MPYHVRMNAERLLARLSKLEGDQLTEAVEKLGRDELLSVLALQAPTLKAASQNVTTGHRVRKALLVVGTAKGMTRAELSRAAEVSSTAVKYQANLAERPKPKVDA